MERTRDVNILKFGVVQSLCVQIIANVFVVDEQPCRRGVGIFSTSSYNSKVHINEGKKS